MAVIDINNSEDIDVGAMIRKRIQKDRDTAEQPFFASHHSYSEERPNKDLKSYFFDPLALESNYYGTVRTISPYYGRQLTCRILRSVAEKAWIINLCITTSISQARPFFKASTQENQRGFRIMNRKAKEAGRDMTDVEKREAKKLNDFFMHTGDVVDPNRVDDLDKYTTKIIRDIYQLDQISTELQRTHSGELCAFWAIDTATIEVALPSTERTTGVKYAQVINHVPHAYYRKEDLIFDCMNPRTDIEKAGYGYSIVEQAIDLVTSSINTFMYNAGFFTENKLPRGILLLNGPADQDEIEDIEDYIANLMSGQPSSQWRVPIIPTGRSKTSESGGRMFEWVNLQGNNKEMEFQAWFDLQLSAIAAMFKKSLEEVGLHSQKSQPIIGMNTEPKQEASKSLGLGDILTFLQKHFNQILEYKNPDYVFEFVGYEKDDLRLVAEIDKSEVDTWKSLNEKRAEKGMEPLDLTKIENPADIPMNVHAVQLYQAQQQGGMGGNPFDMGDGEYSEDDGESDSEELIENEDEKSQVNDEAWGEIENEEPQSVNKALGKKGSVVRIVI